MLGKLLKYDLKKNMRWMWLLFVLTIVVAGLTRGCKELGNFYVFFYILGICFDSVFYALLANVIIQPVLRGILNFSKSLYGDESYLLHTLPVSKNQIINSKFLTTIIEMVLGFASAIISLLIRFVSPTFLPTIEFLLSTIVVGEIQASLFIVLFIILVLVEFLLFISITYFSIIVANRSKEKRVLKTFLITALMYFSSLAVLSIFMLIVLLANGVDLASSKLSLFPSSLFGIIITGMLVYSVISLLFYFLARKEFNKGVNVD